MAYLPPPILLGLSMLGSMLDSIYVHFSGTVCTMNGDRYLHKRLFLYGIPIFNHPFILGYYDALRVADPDQGVVVGSGLKILIPLKSSFFFKSNAVLIHPNF